MPLGGFNSLARSPDGRFISVLARGLGPDTAGIVEIDPETGQYSLLRTLVFPPDPVAPSISNAIVTAAAFGPGGEFYFTKVIPALGGDARPRISDLYVLEDLDDDYRLIGSTVLGQISALDFGPDGILYGWEAGRGDGIGHGLVSMDVSTGVATDIGTAAPGALTQVLTLAFDQAGNLYGAARRLHEVDVHTGEILSSGELASRSSIRGLQFVLVDEPATIALLLGALTFARLRRRGPGPADA